MNAPILPSPTIPSSIIASKLLRGDHHAICRQILPQLRRVSKLNRTHPQGPRTFKIELPVVNEHTFFRLALCYFERDTIDFFIGFPDAKIARAEKSLKLAPELKLPNSPFVELERLVVDG